MPETREKRCFSPFSARWRSDADDSGDWRRKRRLLFLRFGRVFVIVLLLFLLCMTGLAYLLARIWNGGQTTGPIWLVSVFLVLAFPFVLGGLGMRLFTHVANPLARIMAAADAVAQGDLDVRVPEAGPGEFGRLARSFNRMVAELKRSDQLRRNLTADVAHELRTPLHIIQGNLEGILDGVYEADTAHIELLLDETHQLTRLVDDLRTLSLAEAGQLTLKQEVVNVDDLLNDVVTSFSGPAETAGIQLRYDPQPLNSASPLTINGDAGRLDQALSNLVVNALRHTPAGGTVCLRSLALPGKIRLEVADNGEGIPSEDLPYIFDRFWRGDPTRGKTGSGLGLAIARQLIQAQNGSIRVESQLRQGTTFQIDFPEPVLPGNPPSAQPPE
jgi:signal transduction histidine kinase